MKNLTIKEIPELDRPYEKAKKYGINALSDSELLSIVIKTGTKDNNCLELSKQLLSKHSSGLSGFEYLENASIDELMQHSGIGQIKAIQIKAIIELAQRVSKTSDNVYKIRSPIDVYNLLNKEMSSLSKEEIRVVLLDSKNFVKSVVTVVNGSINCASVSMKELLCEPVKQLAVSIILVHNHPSGDPTPSKQDILLTEKVADYASLLDIKLNDHVIIGKNKYVSIRTENPSVFLRRNIL